MWSGGTSSFHHRQDEQQNGTNAPPPAIYNQGGYPPPPPPQENYYSHDYPSDDDENGALSSTINLVTSGVSALFRSSGGAPPPPPPSIPPPTPAAETRGMPPPLQPESSMLNTAYSQEAGAATMSNTDNNPAPPAFPTSHHSATSMPPFATNVAPPPAAMHGMTPPPHAFSAGPPPVADANMPPSPKEYLAAAPPTHSVMTASHAPPVAAEFTNTATNATSTGPPPPVASQYSAGPPVAATTGAYFPPTNTAMNATNTGHPPPVASQYSAGPPVAATTGAYFPPTNTAMNATNTGPPPVASHFSAGPPVVTATTTNDSSSQMMTSKVNDAMNTFPGEEPVATNASVASHGPPVATAYDSGLKRNDGMNISASVSNTGPPPVATEYSTFPPVSTTMEPFVPPPVTTANAASSGPPPSNAASAPPVAAPPTTVASSPMPSPVITSLPSPSNRSHASSLGSGLLPPRSTTPVSASSPRPRYKLPPLSLPRPHASPRTSVSPSSVKKKWGGFKVPPPITSSAKKKVPRGITLRPSTSAPSPMPSPRGMDSSSSIQQDDDVAPAPSPFAPPPPARVTPVGEGANGGFGQSPSRPPNMPQLDDASNNNAPAVVEDSKPPAVVEQPPAPSPLQETTPPPPAPPMVSAPPQVEEETKEEPPVFVAPPPAPQDEVPLHQDAARPPFVAAAAAAPPQMEEPTELPPVLASEPAVAAPQGDERVAPLPAFVSSEEPPRVAESRPPPPEDDGFNEPPLAIGVSPEDERPWSDQRNERSPSNEYPEETVTQQENESSHEQAQLPVGWSEEVDPSSGQSYYYNSVTGETSWDLPTFDGSIGEEVAIPSEERPPEQTFSHDERDMDEATESHQEEIPESLSALPAGWTQEMDHSTGLPYYYNEESGETSWDRPTGSTETGERTAETSEPGEEDNIVPTSSKSSLPVGWTEEVDELTGRRYYYHVERDITTWERPVEEPSVAEGSEHEAAVPDLDTKFSAEGAEESKDDVQEETEHTGRDASMLENIADENEAAAPLPDGWTEHIDPASGRPYYVNSAENATSWERPSVESANDAEAIAEPPTVSRSTGRDGMDSLPESTSFGNVEETVDLGESETAPLAEPDAGGEDENMQEDLHQLQQEATRESSSELPEEWEEIVDPDSGRVYYYNAADGTTSWDPPVVPVPAESLRPVSDSEPERTSETELSSAAPENPPMSSESWNLVSSQGSYDTAGDQHGITSHPEVHIESAVSVDEGTAESTEQAGSGAPGTESLPPNWIELTDPSSGNKYYLNELTSETTWDRPANRMTPEEEILPATDDAEVSPTTEQPAFENHANAEESEDVGTDLGTISMEVNVNESLVKTDEGDLQEGAEFHEQESVTTSSLPQGWTELIDPSSGRAYYFNETENATTWDRPTATAETDGEDSSKLEAELTHDPQAVHEEKPDTKPILPSDDSLDGAVDGEGDAISGDNEAAADDVGLHPEEQNKSETEVLPPGWVEMIDQSSGRPYYFNEVDNITTWEKPIAEPDTTETAHMRTDELESDVNITEPCTEEAVLESDVSVSSHADAQVESKADLPSGWVEMTDPSSGKPYYFNEIENVTTWERPEAVVVKSTKSVEDVPRESEVQAPEPELQDEISDGYTMVEHSEASPEKVREKSGPVQDTHTESEDQTDLPPGWLELVDEASGAPYYLNEAENITTWDRPTLQKEAPITKKTKLPTKEPSLKEGWSEIVDPSSGKAYYFNEETGETTWDRPSAPSATEFPAGEISSPQKSGQRSPARVFATFGFGGRLCAWKAKAPTTVAIYRTGDIMKEDPVVVAETTKKKSNILGPLNASDQGAVMNHFENKAIVEKPGESPSLDLLWKLAHIAAKSNGRLRSDDGVRNPASPEARIIHLLLDEDGEPLESTSRSVDEDDSQDYAMRGEVASTSSLKKVEQLLLRGQREEAVQEALSSNNFAMALLVASMCDRSTFQKATKEFADEILSNGSPLHTLAMLFSGQLQPPADSALDRTGTKPSIWDNESQHLDSTWRQHLAATISNRTLGWDRIVLALGDHLLESGNVHAAHFCYMVCGCPVTSLLHPSSRMCLVGCDHVVPVDAALMTPEGVAGYERTEAYEWAKRKGNPNAAIPSLQPFKLMYAMLLADMGLTRHAQLYVESIRQCCGLEGVKEGYSIVSVPSTLWSLSDGSKFKDALNEFEDRLSQGKYLSPVKSLVKSRGRETVAGNETVPVQPAAGVDKDSTAKKKKKVKRVQRNLSPRRSSVVSMDTVSEDEAFIEPGGNAKEEDVNATFLSAQSNLLDVTASSAIETLAPSMMKPATIPASRHQEFVRASSQEHKLDQAAEGRPSDTAGTGAPPMMMQPVKPEAKFPGKDEESKKEAMRKSIRSPPASAPAAMVATKKDKSVTGSPQKAPSSDKKGKWGFGITEKMNKWLNPDATTADLGEGMQAYYDEKRKVWVFPGDDPDDVAKPIGPPPTIPAKAPEETMEEPPDAPQDPLAAMMAPPKRAPSFRRSSSALSTMENARLAASRYPPGMPSTSTGGPPMAAAAGPPPQFTVFKPAPAPAKEE